MQINLNLLNEWIWFMLGNAFGVGIVITLSRIIQPSSANGGRINNFSWWRFIALLSIPLITVFILSLSHGSIVWWIYGGFSLVGSILEWLIGFSYHKLMGHKLWQYQQYSVHGYTSWLSIPLWGLAGVMFWLLAKAFV